MRRRVQRLMISVLGLGLVITVTPRNASAAIHRARVCDPVEATSCEVCEQYCDSMQCVVYDCWPIVASTFECECGL